MLILVAVSIAILTGENGLLTKATIAKERQQKEEATELLKLKLTDCQMESLKENEKLPTLEYIAEFLEKDKKEKKDIEYVQPESKLDNPTFEGEYSSWEKIYTKLEKYPYEFEINKDFQVAIDGEEETIPMGYMKIPTETLNITTNGEYEVLDKAKVNVNVTTDKKYTETEYQNYGNSKYSEGNTAGYTQGYNAPKTSSKTMQVTYPNNSSSVTIDFGNVPSIVFISVVLISGEHKDIFSYDSCKTFYVGRGSYSEITTTCTTNDCDSITFVPVTPSSWYGATFFVYAIE